MGGQLIRCGTAPAFHYGESQSAESPKDFIHKIRIAHKELKESRSNIRMLKGAELLPVVDEGMNWLLNEFEELIKIFGKILSTAKKNLGGDKDPNDGRDSAANASRRLTGHPAGLRPGLLALAENRGDHYIIRPIPLFPDRSGTHILRRFRRRGPGSVG